MESSFIPLHNDTTFQQSLVWGISNLVVNGSQTKCAKFSIICAQQNNQLSISNNQLRISNKE